MVRPAQAAVERVVTPDGEGGERHVWFVGDDAECAVIDPVGDLGALLGHCELRRLRAILWTSLSPGSVGTALSLADRTGAVTYLHRDDLPLWRRAEPERGPQARVAQDARASRGGEGEVVGSGGAAPVRWGAGEG